MVNMYKKLPVWRKANELGNRLYDVTQYFPHDKDRILVDQIRYDSDRIVLSIERSATESNCTEYIRHFKESYDTTLHLRRIVMQSKTRGYVGSHAYAEIERTINDVLISITRYIRMLEFVNSSLDASHAYSYSLLL
ncbi:four helix bundle protein, partial [Candidatus Omnitrophota bacterium]